MNLKWVRIFEGMAEPEQVFPIEFKAGNHQKKAVGVLFTADCHVSLAFDNNTNVKLNKIPFSYHNERFDSPKKRVIPLDEVLTNLSTIKGTIKNLRKSHQHQFNKPRKIDVFLLLEQEDYDC